MQHLGAVLRWLGISNQDIADLVGIRASSVTNYATGHRSPSRARLSAIFEFVVRVANEQKTDLESTITDWEDAEAERKRKEIEWENEERERKKREAENPAPRSTREKSREISLNDFKPFMEHLWRKLNRFPGQGFYPHQLARMVDDLMWNDARIHLISLLAKVGEFPVGPDGIIYADPPETKSAPAPQSLRPQPTGKIEQSTANGLIGI